MNNTDRNLYSQGNIVIKSKRQNINLDFNSNQHLHKSNIFSQNFETAEDKPID